MKPTQYRDDAYLGMGESDDGSDESGSGSVASATSGGFGARLVSCLTIMRSSPPQGDADGVVGGGGAGSPGHHHTQQHPGRPVWGHTRSGHIRLHAGCTFTVRRDYCQHRVIHNGCAVSSTVLCTVSCAVSQLPVCAAAAAAVAAYIIAVCLTLSVIVLCDTVPPGLLPPPQRRNPRDAPDSAAMCWDEADATTYQVCVCACACASVKSESRLRWSRWC